MYLEEMKTVNLPDGVKLKTFYIRKASGARVKKVSGDLNDESITSIQIRATKRMLEIEGGLNHA